MCRIRSLIMLSNGVGSRDNNLRASLAEDHDRWLFNVTGTDDDGVYDIGTL